MLKLAAAFILPALCFAASPIIDNERVRIWKVEEAPAPTPEFDFITVTLPEGRAALHKAGEHINSTNVVVIELKNHPVAPLKNTSGLVDAFPRDGSKKILDDPRFTIWDYSWLLNKPTPMHFHAKDAIVTYLGKGAIKSTTQDGKSQVSEYTPGVVKFNARERIHSEELMNGSVRAVIVELK